MKKNKPIFVALVGNPNCGKTALFNGLTGSRQKIGNWPGVTVERKSGWFECGDQTVEVVDLPGTYSVATTDDMAMDERIACEFLQQHAQDHEKQMVIVNVLDGSHLVRHLYLTLQLLELNIPIILAVNMMDIVQSRGLSIDVDTLMQLTGCPVVLLTAHRLEGVEVLKKRIRETALTADTRRVMHVALRWEEAVPLGEGLDADIMIADARYRLAVEWADQVVKVRSDSHVTQKKSATVTDKIDRIVLHRFFGIPLFLFIMYVMFAFAIDAGGWVQNFFSQYGQAILVDGLGQLLLSWGWPGWMAALFAKGGGTGINTVITFAPILGAMFFCLALLESSGYMARAAFLMDRLMRTLGLPGNAFVPMIVGFGCNVPAVVGTRTLANLRDRILTVMMVPFMSCGARLAIFSVFASAFFPHYGAEIIFILYMLGVLVAVLSAWVLKKTVLPGRVAPLIMELPAYHMPRVGALCWQAWHRLKDFLWRAGKYIVPVCVLIGLLDSIDTRGRLIETSSSHTLSVLAVGGQVMTPLFAPLGIRAENWPATVGLLTGIVAKEVVIGTLNSLYGRIDRDARVEYGVMVRQFDGSIGAFAYLLFVLLYFPCISTMAAIRHELGARWAYFSVVWSTILAYALSVIVYQGLTWMRHPFTASIWMISMIGLLGLMCMGLRHKAHTRGKACY